MQIIFTSPTELGLIEDYSLVYERPIIRREFFQEGEIVNVDIISENSITANLQFEDGSEAHDVPRENFKTHQNAVSGMAPAWTKAVVG